MRGLGCKYSTDFMAFNHGPDSGGSWDEAEAAVRRTHPHWAEHALAYRANFGASLVGVVLFGTFLGAM